MKHLKLFIVIILGSLFFNSCAEDEIDLFGSISGTVKDGISLEPLSGVTLTLSPSGKTIATGSDGIFEFDELEAGKYTISVSKDKYGSDSKSITVSPGRTSQADFAIQTANGALELSISVLDFGKNDLDLGFDIKNIGKNDMTFEIENSYDWINVSPSTGVISSNRIEPIIVTIDRSKIDENKSVRLPISSNAGSSEIEIKVDLDDMAAQMELSKTILDFEDTNDNISFDISNKGKSDLEFSIGEIGEWITFSPVTATVAPGKLTTVVATIDRSKITESMNKNLTITSNVASKELPVKVTYVANKPAITISKTNLSFGEDNTTLSFDVSNTGNANLEFSIGEVGNWISFSPAKGTIVAGKLMTVVATIDRSKITESINQNIAITSNAGSKELSITVVKPIDVGVLEVSTLSIDFEKIHNQKTFIISNSGTASFNYQLKGNYPWLTVSESSGTVLKGQSKTITIYANRNKIFGEVSEILTVSTDVGEKKITIKANEPINYGTIIPSTSEHKYTITNITTSAQGDLTISFTLQNNGGDMNIDFGGNNSIASDIEGNTYYADYPHMQILCTLAGQEADNNDVRVTLLGNTKSKGTITIKGVPAGVSHINVLKLRADEYGYNGPSFSDEFVVFKNIPVIR